MQLNHLAPYDELETSSNRTRRHRFSLESSCSKRRRRRIIHVMAPTSVMHIPDMVAFVTLTVLISNSLLTTSTLAFHQRTEEQLTDPKCQSTDSFFCDINNYETVRPFNNSIGHTSLEAAKSSLHEYAFLLSLPQCTKRVQLFLCSLYFPVCASRPDMPTVLLQPCRDTCEEAYQCEPHIRSALNQTWPKEWDCDKFQYYADDKLCVIDNRQNSGEPPRPPPENGVSSNPKFTLPNNPLLPMPPMPPADSDTSVCDQGLFDCRLSDSKRPLCIEKKYVCDRKKDCYRNDSLGDPNEGMDEMGCTPSEGCEEGQLHCDDRCISRHDICNGKVDCSSGIDEQDCVDSWTGMIQIFLLVFAMLSIVYRVVKFMRAGRDIEDGEQPSYESPYEIEGEANLIASQPDVIKGALMSPEAYKQLPPTPLIPQLHSVEGSPSCFDSTYQAPSILTRSDAYDTARIGGDSGACSVYAYGPLGNPRRACTPPPAPPAPPSTPLPEVMDFVDPVDFPGYHDNHIYVNMEGKCGASTNNTSPCE